MNRRILHIIIEILWLVIAAVCFGCGVYLLVKAGYEAQQLRIIICFVLGIVSILMSIIRRMQRKNEEKRESRFKQEK